MNHLEVVDASGKKLLEIIPHPDGSAYLKAKVEIWFLTFVAGLELTREQMKCLREALKE